jgi:hypothetical protein
MALATAPTPENIRGILQSANSTFVSITFTKANGEVRQLTTNPKHIGEILGTGKPCKDPAVFRIMDAKLNQWRSFRAERVQSIKANGTTVNFSASAC